MKKPVIFLRLSYWIAAIADFGIAGLILIPERMGVAEAVYPMGLASAAAFSWGVLLLIADRKPIERKWVLIPTILVVALLSSARIYFSLTSTIEFSLTFLLFGLTLIGFMGFSYWYANQHNAQYD